VRSIIIIFSLVFIVLYGVFFTLDALALQHLTQEDGVIEWFGALCFLAACVLLFRVFYRTKYAFILLLGIACFFAFGEEISWGQRIIGFKTPESIEKINAQKEFNIHNLKWIQHKDTIGMDMKSILNFNRLFIIFWISYCVILPIVFKYGTYARSIILRLKIPVLPIWFGVLFFINEITCKYLDWYLDNKWLQRLGENEVKEAIWGLLILLISIYWTKKKKSMIGCNTPNDL